MAKFEKYSVKILANQIFCLPLSLRTGRECTTTKDILVSCSNSVGRSLVALLPRVVVTCSQNKRGCALSFYTYVKRIFDLQCEQVSRIRSRRKVRPKQTSRPRNGRNPLLNRHQQMPQSSPLVGVSYYALATLRSRIPTLSRCAECSTTKSSTTRVPTKSITLLRPSGVRSSNFLRPTSLLTYGQLQFTNE